MYTTVQINRWQNRPVWQVRYQHFHLAKKKKQKTGEIDLCGGNAWNGPCMALKKGWEIDLCGEKRNSTNQLTNKTKQSKRRKRESCVAIRPVWQVRPATFSPLAKKI